MTVCSSHCTTDYLLVPQRTVLYIYFITTSRKSNNWVLVSIKFRSNVKHVPFHIVPDRLKPIIGTSDALALGLTSFHCPIFNDWQSNSNLTNSVDSIHSNAHSTVCRGTGIVNLSIWEFTMDTLTKQAITNHPKYSHLLSGIGHFKCKPVHITMIQNATPVQKPPRRVPIAMKDK